jgi:hypothetical protein
MPMLYSMLIVIRPRWLCANGRADEARRILARLHSSTGDLHSPLIDLEMAEIEEHVRRDGADSAFRVLCWSSASHFLLQSASGTLGRFSGPSLTGPALISSRWSVSNLDKLLFLCLLVNSMSGCFGQLSGNGLITYFLPVLLANAGIKSQSKRLTLNFVNSVSHDCNKMVRHLTCSRLLRTWVPWLVRPQSIALGGGASYCMPRRFALYCLPRFLVS